MFPPTAELSERITPPEGDTIHGYKIPGGVFIGLNVRGIQRHRIYGEDMDIYQPERWLHVESEQLAEMTKTLDLVFGYGDTRCLGYNLAQMTISKIIFEVSSGGSRNPLIADNTKLLRKFDVVTTNPAKPWISECYGLFFQRDFNVRLICREKRTTLE